MKVLHINCNYLTTALHQTMLEHLDKENVDSLVFAPTFDANKAVIEPHENVIVSECFNKWDRVFFDYKQSKIYSAIKKSVAADEFDCIHAYTLFTDGNSAMRFSKYTGKPYVVAVRDTDVNTFFKYMPHLRSRGVKILMGASKVFFLSTTYRDFVLENYIPESKKEAIMRKSYIMPNGIDDFWFENSCSDSDIDTKQKRFDDKLINIVFAGRINENKNPITTLKAVDILEKKGYNVKFTVIGDFEDSELKRVLLSDNRVEYVPKIPKEKLVEYYRENDIFVMPSHQETFGLVYAEAMSQGLPVLYTKGQGFDGQFEDGEVGYAINSHSPEDIAEKILFVIQNYNRLSKNCSKMFLRFKWKDIVKKYAQYYEEIKKDYQND